MTDAKLPPKLTKDLDLAIEEEHAALHAKYEALRKTHADFISRFEHLQRSRDDLLERAEETDRQLKSIQNSNHGDQAEYIKNLIKRKEEAEDLITNQELRIEDDRKIKESQLKELNSLRPAAQRLVELEDQVKELKVENTALSKKANAGKNFERKLEAMKDVEKQNARLREQIDTLGENQRDYDKVYASNEVMKTTIEEYKKQFEAYELGVIEINTQKRVLNDELRAAQAKIFELESRKSHDDDYINQLQEQMRTNISGPLSPDSPTTRTGLSLGEELEQSDNLAPSHDLEISRLRAENQLLRSNTAGTDNANLRIDLEEAERMKKRLEELNSELFEKHAIAQQQLQAIIGTSLVEKLVPVIDHFTILGALKILTEDCYRDEAILRTRNLYMEANQELSAAKSKLAEFQADLTSRDRELLAAKADCKFLNSLLLRSFLLNGYSGRDRA
jgi:protein HOOK3